MRDWTQFREAISAGLPNFDRLAHLRKMNGWLDLPVADAMARLQEELKTCEARPLYQTVVVLNLMLQREAGIPVGPESAAALQQLFQEVQNGQATDGKKQAVGRLSVLWQLGGYLLQQDPTLSQGPSAADLAKSKLQQEATEIFARLNAVENQTTPGTVTDGSIRTMEEVLGSAQALIQSASPDNGGLPYALYMTGGTARTLARCYAIVGRNDDALKAYAAAAQYFERAGEPEQSKDCANQRKALAQALSGNLDQAAAESLAILNAASPDGDPWLPIKARMDLADVASNAGDTFEALQNAEAAAVELVNLGYPDPGVCGAEAAMDAWIASSSTSLKGIPLLKLVSQVATWYDTILGARFADRIRKDRVAADALLALQVEVQKLSHEMHQEAKSAQEESSCEFQRYFPPPPGQEPPPPSSNTGAETLLDRMRAVDQALGQLRETCNERASAGASMDDLLAAVEELEAQADTLNSPEYEAKARLERAYILLQAGRAAAVGAVARAARERLLAGRPATLSSFAQSHERYLYLDSLKREIMACIMTGDMEGALKECEETIRDFETERYRVNSEYRQSALLSYVTEFYTWAVFSAFKLQRWDNMLEAIDLMKARSVMRTRLIPYRPETLQTDLSREFEQVSDAATREPANAGLLTRRRQLWDLLSISSGEAETAGEIPLLSVASVQAALAEDEALISYFWLSETVILAVAVDRQRFHAERIMLQPDEVTSLREFISFIRTLKTSHKMDREVANLGAILLPAFLRDFIQSKKRLILSPHHSLHLFPFHAARWGDGFVGTEFAVRYVPNLCSLLVPWIRNPEDRVLTMGIRKFADPAVQLLESVEEDAVDVAGFYRANGSAVETLIGADATRQRMEALRNEGSLEKFRCVHLGTHGLSVFETPAQPLESRLLVQDGALDSMDIANLRMRADLVVLCACHSGQRAIELRDLGEVPGDDIFGLQAAFFRSGVRSIMGTLWLVETTSSSPITRAFHKHYAAGQPEEIALQLSIKEYLASAPPGRGVYYWAPYFVSSIGKLN